MVWLTIEFSGTIRGDFCLATGRNICHGSDSVENAEKEIALWVHLFFLFLFFILIWALLAGSPRELSSTQARMSHGSTSKYLY